MRTRLPIVVLSAVLAACSHATPPPVRVASIPPAPVPVDRSIGTATMLDDGTIVMELRTSTDGDGDGHLIQKLKPGDVQYAATLRQLGGLKPGQSKPIVDYPMQ